MFKLSRIKLNARGFSTHIVIPVLAVVAIAGIGTYTLTRSHAATPPVITNLFGYTCSATGNVAPTLRQGSTGSCVKVLQTGLNNYNQVNNFFSHRIVIGMLTVDGQFGPQTTNAVKYFQSRHGLASDGIVGPATWTAFLRSCVTLNGPNQYCFTTNMYN